jgi:hypothetical protein
VGLFWPSMDADRESRVAQLDQARRICVGCPYRQPCLYLGMREYAQRRAEDDCESVWGGAIFPDEFSAERRLAARARIPA